MGDPTELADRLERETMLSPLESEVVAHRIGSMSFHEIGDTLNMSPQSASKHWQRAKEKAAEAKQSVAVFEEIGLIE